MAGEVKQARETLAATFRRWLRRLGWWSQTPRKANRRPKHWRGAR